MLHILLVDDDPNDRLLVIRELEREFSDLRITEVTHAEALEQAISETRFNLVITDYRLHWSNGLVVLRTIKSRYPDCPVIMFTNTGNEEIAVEAMKAGLDDYIIKSSRYYMRLSVAIRAVLERTTARQQVGYLENRLQLLLNRTAQLEDMIAQLEAFAYSISHDLTVPLRAISGLTQLLLRDSSSQLDAIAQNYLKRIDEATELMSTLIENLLDYSRISSVDLQLEPTHLSTIVTQALTQLATELEQTQAIVMVEEPLRVVLAHPHTLLRVVINLLSNAIKFVAAHSQPQIRIWAEELTEADDCATDGESTFAIRLWIEDNGVGIAPDSHERIFEMFERLHGVEAYPGMGIGLAIARQGVERMGGHIGVESTLGQGSRFWIKLRRCEL